MSLQDKRIVVVGGTSGMGFATARAAAEAGARVLVAGRRQDRIDAALASLPAGAEGQAADITVPDQVAALFARAGQVDALVVCAHAGESVGRAIAPLAEGDLAAMKAFFDAKFWGTVQACRAVLPRLTAAGAIVLVSGAASRKPLPGHTILGAVNGAVESFARQLASEIRPRRVNVVSPGLVDTEVYAAMPAAQRTAMFEAKARALPVGRVGRPEDVAAMVLHLIANTYVTGAVIDVDGGGMVA